MVTEETMANWLMKRAHISPERIAMEFTGGSYTYKQLERETEVMARKLWGKGIRAGNTVALLSGNSAETVVCIHALFYIGAKILFLNQKLTAPEISWQVEDGDAAWVLVESRSAERVSQLDRSILLIESASKWLEDEGAIFQKEFRLSETATIMYTSGTSGNPKGVIHTYGNHWWSAIGSVLNLGLREEDTWLCAVPIFHISGFSILMKNIIYGMKIVLFEKFDEDKVNEAIMNRGVTIISVVTATLNRLLQNLGDRTYPSGFRCMLLGGGPAPQSILEVCKGKGIPVYQTYGMTETASQIVTLAPEDSMNRIGSAGKALFPSMVKIEKDGVETNASEAGEIVVSGPNVTKGYINHTDKTNQAIKDGWLYTGDIGLIDEEGYLYVLDRRSDLIISGGENVYPAEIESVLMQHEAVFEAGVTSRPDPKWGEVPVAFVVRSPEAAVTEASLINHARQYLAAYKVPVKIIFCNSLPRNASNKLVRRELKKWL